MKKAKYDVQWNAQEKLLSIRIQGQFTQQDVKNWQQQLYVCAEAIPTASEFKLLLDERGYDYVSTAVHHAKRDVLPKFLARYQMILSVLPVAEQNLLVSETELNTNNIRCCAMAMCHHNVEAMQQLQQQYGTEQQGYFGNIEEARAWISKKDL